MKYKRILLKLSGEALQDKKGGLTLDANNLENISRVMKSLHDEGVEIAVVIGGGNIWRGKIAEKVGIERVPADFMGMLGTVINAVALASNLKRLGVETVVYSAVPPIEGVTVSYDKDKVINDLNNGKVCFLAGGTGKPYFSTDTAAALRALEVNCDAIIMGKNGVKGVYDKDPLTNADAKFFETVTYKEMIDLKLQVMDQSAIELIKDTDLQILVFSMSDPNNFIQAVNGVNVGTICKR